jgi:hypothetical protein
LDSDGKQVYQEPEIHFGGTYIAFERALLAFDKQKSTKPLDLTTSKYSSETLHALLTVIPANTLATRRNVFKNPIKFASEYLG